MGIIEIGGQPGDAESPHFIEAIRQMKKDLGRENVCYVHVVPLFFIEHLGEYKTKPIQNSIRELRQTGITPDMMVCRAPGAIPDDIREKISLFTDIEQEDVITAANAPTIYEVPLIFADQDVHRRLEEKLALPKNDPDLHEWGKIVERIKNPKKHVHVGIIGKYVQIEDAYASIKEALIHAGVYHETKIHQHWIESEDIEKDPSLLEQMHVS